MEKVRKFRNPEVQTEGLSPAPASKTWDCMIVTNWLLCCAAGEGGLCASLLLAPRAAPGQGEDPGIPLLIHYFVAHGSSLQTKVQFIFRCSLYMDKDPNVADTWTCGL